MSKRLRITAQNIICFRNFDPAGESDAGAGHRLIARDHGSFTAAGQVHARRLHHPHTCPNWARGEWMYIQWYTRVPAERNEIILQLSSWGKLAHSLVFLNAVIGERFCCPAWFCKFTKWLIIRLVCMWESVTVFHGVCWVFSRVLTADPQGWIQSRVFYT